MHNWIPTGDQIELYYAEMEPARNDAEDKYFNARPQLAGTIEQRTLFKAGYERAFKMMWDKRVAAKLGGNDK